MNREWEQWLGWKPQGWKFEIGDLVWKPKGSWWAGKVVGVYSTPQTPKGYAVQLVRPGGNGPVQIYPEEALDWAGEDAGCSS